MGGRAIFDAIELAEIGAGDVGHLPPVRTDADVDGGFTEVDRLQLRMDVGDVDQADVAEGVELQKLILGEALLRGQPGPVAEAGGADQSRSRHGHLQEIAS